MIYLPTKPTNTTSCNIKIFNWTPTTTSTYHRYAPESWTGNASVLLHKRVRCWTYFSSTHFRRLPSVGVDETAEDAELLCLEPLIIYNI